MKLVENISKDRLKDISNIIGEAFVINELFYEFGSIEERRKLVLKYMEFYVEFVYKSNALFMTDDGHGFIGLMYSDKGNKILQFKMLFNMLKVIPFKVLKKFLKHIKQISNGNSKYTKNTYLEVFLVCVEKKYQGKGKLKELINFAKEMAKKRNVPILFDTDMKLYAQMYEHLGCKLYNIKKASNGIVRYNLVWKSE